jgi:hypothetical protein
MCATLDTYHLIFSFQQTVERGQFLAVANDYFQIHGVQPFLRTKVIDILN